MVLDGQMETLQEEIDGLRKSSTESSEQMARMKSQLAEKDEDLKSLQADSKRQLVEVYEMKCVVLFLCRCRFFTVHQIWGHDVA